MQDMNSCNILILQYQNEIIKLKFLLDKEIYEKNVLLIENNTIIKQHLELLIKMHNDKIKIKIKSSL